MEGKELEGCLQAKKAAAYLPNGGQLCVDVTPKSG